MDAKRRRSTLHVILCLIVLRVIFKLCHNIARIFDVMVTTSTWDSRTTSSSLDTADPVEVINPASVTGVGIARCLTR